MLPWLMYERYGDREILERMFPAMQRWLEQQHGLNPDGIRREGRGEDYGDWQPAGPDTSHELFATCWLYRSTVVGHQVATLLDKHLAAKWLGDRAEAVRAAFLDCYVDAASGRVADPHPSSSVAAGRFTPVVAEETQTGYTLALAFGLLSGDVVEKAGQRLRDLVVGAGRRLQTGIVGSAFLLEALQRGGFPGLAYELLLRTEFPSLGFMVAQGATSVWERWDGLEASGWPGPVVSSFNHFTFGSMLTWLVEGVCGLRLAEGVPAFRKITFNPAVTRRVRDSTFEFDSPQGRLSVGWQWQGESDVIGHVSVPPGSSCSVARVISIDDDLSGAEAAGDATLRPGSGSQGQLLKAGEHEVLWKCAV